MPVSSAFGYCVFYFILHFKATAAAVVAAMSGDKKKSCSSGKEKASFFFCTFWCSCDHFSDKADDSIWLFCHLICLASLFPSQQQPQLFSFFPTNNSSTSNRGTGCFCGSGGDCGELRALITLHWAEWPEKEEESVVQSMNLAQKQQQLQGPCVVTDHFETGTDK